MDSTLFDQKQTRFTVQTVISNIAHAHIKKVEATGLKSRGDTCLKKPLKLQDVVLSLPRAPHTSNFWFKSQVRQAKVGKLMENEP